MSEAKSYYESLKGEWKVGLRGEFPVLNKVNEDHYELGRGNDLGIDVDKFIAGCDEVETTPSDNSDDLTVNIEETEEVYEDENYDDVAE